jgi:hypothetical protein
MPRQRRAEAKRKLNCSAKSLIGQQAELSQAKPLISAALSSPSPVRKNSSPNDTVLDQLNNGWRYEAGRWKWEIARAKTPWPFNLKQMTNLKMLRLQFHCGLEHFISQSAGLARGNALFTPTQKPVVIPH